MVLDTRNYNDRLLYLDLYPYRRQVSHLWQDNKELGSFIQSQRPLYVLHTRYPRNNHDLFSITEGGNTAQVAGVDYVLEAAFGIFTVYRLASVEG